MDFHFKESTKENVTCPLGAICSSCSWSMPMFEETNSGKFIEAGKMCALVSNALMSDRMAARVDGVHSAINSFRNEMVVGNDKLIGEIGKNPDLKVIAK